MALKVPFTYTVTKYLFENIRLVSLASGTLMLRIYLRTFEKKMFKWLVLSGTSLDRCAVGLSESVQGCAHEIFWCNVRAAAPEAHGVVRVAA